MDINLQGKKITLAITGGIASYKAAEIVSWLVQKGADVQVAMTEGATHFITPLTLKALSGHSVAVDIMTTDSAFNIPHIDIADCDLFIVLPATANILAKSAAGLADDLISAALLATKAPVLLAPAMNVNMYCHLATQANIKLLAERGCFFIEPGIGYLACGTEGQGRLADMSDIKEQIIAKLIPQNDLQGIKILITAGPTRERIDPVRYISNFSSGKMGYALAEAAQKRGAQITLISGPCCLKPPFGVKTVSVESALEMQMAVEEAFADTDIVIKAAAVADYRCRETALQKMKKGLGLQLELTANPDILAALGEKKGDKLLIGFAAETNDLDTYAQSKMQAKNLDMIVGNNIALPGAGFDVDTNIITIFSADGEREAYCQMSKKEAAEKILDKICLLPRFREILQRKEV